jgi:hypothetical protein
LQRGKFFIQLFNVKATRSHNVLYGLQNIGIDTSLVLSVTLDNTPAGRVAVLTLRSQRDLESLSADIEDRCPRALVQIA